MELHLQSAGKDFFSLTKPRVVLLHLITASAAMFLAAGNYFQISILLSVLIGGGMVAGAANTLNCILDRDIDKMMSRTRLRPLAAGRIQPGQALVFSIGMGSVGFIILGSFVNWTAALLSVGALIYYIAVYTIWLKRRTYWSSIIGSGAGIFPPLIGWYAVTGTIGIPPFLLSGLIIFWTPLHFWSLAVFRKADYDRIGIKVVPDQKLPIWLAGFSLLLAVISLAISQIVHTGWLYSGTALLLNICLFLIVTYFIHEKTDQSSKYLYRYSVIYLTLLFGFLLVDSLVR